MTNDEVIKERDELLVKVINNMVQDNISREVIEITEKVIMEGYGLLLR